MKIIHSLKPINLDAKTMHMLSIKIIKQCRKICSLNTHRSRRNHLTHCF
ncbi:Uncharacterised protein [Raoultella terrigena]|nr:Uncharacterised protein [Raoultella terrigena]VTM21431.1 Uncharacterised protein [Raoultella terrigena]